MKLAGRFIDTRRIIPLAVIIIFMVVTVGHVANYAGSFEATGWFWLGWPYALAVDVAIIICSYFTKWATTERLAWIGYLLFALASGVMNAAAIRPWAKAEPFPAWVYAEFPTVAIALLGFLYRSVDKLVAGKERKHSETSQQESETKPTESQLARYVCGICGAAASKSGKLFASQKALNAHQRAHAGLEADGNGSEPATVAEEAG